jgi:hypothetical protein
MTPAHHSREDGRDNLLLYRATNDDELPALYQEWVTCPHGASE